MPAYACAVGGVTDKLFSYETLGARMGGTVELSDILRRHIGDNQYIQTTSRQLPTS